MMRSESPTPPLTTLSRAETPQRSNTEQDNKEDEDGGSHVDTGSKKDDHQIVDDDTDEGDQDLPPPSFEKRNQTTDDTIIKPVYSDEFLGTDLYRRRNKDNRKSTSGRGTSSGRAPPVTKSNTLPPRVSAANSFQQPPVTTNMVVEDVEDDLPHYEPSWCDFMWCCDRSQANVVVLKEVPKPPPPPPISTPASPQTPATTATKDTVMEPSASPTPVESTETTKSTNPPLPHLTAIVTIQRYWRGHYVRWNSTEHGAQSVRTLRKLQRQRRERKQQNRPQRRETRLERAERYYAAVIIQGHWRHYQSWRQQLSSRPTSPGGGGGDATKVDGSDGVVPPTAEHPIEQIMEKLSPRLQDPLRRVLEKHILRNQLYGNQLPRRRSADVQPTPRPVYQIRRTLSTSDLESLSGALRSSWGRMEFSPSSSVVSKVGISSEKTHSWDEHSSLFSSANSPLVRTPKSPDASQKTNNHNDEEGKMNTEEDGQSVEAQTVDSDEPASPASSHAYALPASLCGNLERYLDETSKQKRASHVDSNISVDTGRDSRYTGETITSLPDGEDEVEFQLDRTVRAGSARPQPPINSSSPAEESNTDTSEDRQGDESSNGYEPDISQSSSSPQSNEEFSSKVDIAGQIVKQGNEPIQQNTTNSQSEEDSLSASRLGGSYSLISKEYSDDDAMQGSQVSAEEYYGYGNFHESCPSVAMAIGDYLAEEERALLNPTPSKEDESQVRRSKSMPMSKDWPDLLFSQTGEKAKSKFSKHSRGSEGDGVINDSFENAFIVATTTAKHETSPTPDVMEGVQADPRGFSSPETNISAAKRSDGNEHAANVEQSEQMLLDHKNDIPQKQFKKGARELTSTQLVQSEDVLDFGPLHAEQTKKKVTAILKNMKNRISPTKNLLENSLEENSARLQVDRPAVKDEVDAKPEHISNAVQPESPHSEESKMNEEVSEQPSEVRLSVQKFLSKIPKTPSPMRHTMRTEPSDARVRQETPPETSVGADADAPQQGNREEEKMEEKPRQKDRQPHHQKSNARSKSPLRLIQSGGKSHFVGDTDVRRFIREYLQTDDRLSSTPMKRRLNDHVLSVRQVTPEETPSTPRAWPEVHTQYIHRTRPISLKETSPSSGHQESVQSPTASPLPATQLFPLTPNLRQAYRRTSSERKRRSSEYTDRRSSADGTPKSISSDHYPQNTLKIRRPLQWPIQSKHSSANGKDDIKYEMKVREGSKDSTENADEHALDHVDDCPESAVVSLPTASPQSLIQAQVLPSNNEETKSQKSTANTASLSADSLPQEDGKELAGKPLSVS